jgi:hypothetical protein
MGARGPIPKRSEDRRRRNRADVHVAEAFGPVEVPQPDPSWHQLAASWYASLRESGQVAYFEPSDWAAAQLLAHEMSRMLQSRPSANLFAAIWSGMGDLLTTEGERRRFRIEVHRRPVAPVAASPVSNLDDYRDL